MSTPILYNNISSFLIYKWSPSFFSGKVMELYSERDRGCGHRFKWKSCTLHFRKVARVRFSRRPTICHMHLESKWVIEPWKCPIFTPGHFCQTTKLSLMCVCVCRPHASGPRAVLWLHPVCSGVEWAGFHHKTSAAPHRHTLQAGPEVGKLLICLLCLFIPAHFGITLYFYCFYELFVIYSALIDGIFSCQFV